MQYVKLIAKPNSWFKQDTEVYDYDSSENNKFRITLENWEKYWMPSQIVLVRGTRICENKSELLEIGKEYFDGESCSISEFNVSIVDEPV